MRFSAPKRKYYEPIVQNNLAVTPEQLAEMTAKGIPISTNNLSGGFEETTTSGHDVPMEFQRGVDLNDVWNAKETAKKKARKLKFEEPSKVD